MNRDIFLENLPYAELKIVTNSVDLVSLVTWISHTGFVIVRVLFCDVFSCQSKFIRGICLCSVVVVFPGCCFFSLLRFDMVLRRRETWAS